MKPFIDDVESFELVTADGRVLTCSREENAELFRLVIGGYGLFGIVTNVGLRLSPRRLLERSVKVRGVSGLMRAFEERIEQGFEFGDFQFAIDPESTDFLNRGVFSCYRPVPGDQQPTNPQHTLGEAEWQQLLELAHRDKSAAFHCYAEHYLDTDGQRYWSDEHQLALYLDDYHEALDARLGACVPGCETISELYVPRERFEEFMIEARALLRRRNSNLIYGTVRLIERDSESLLAWARKSWACIIFNLHVDRSPDGIARVKSDFRALYDLAVAFGGSFFLTYHHWARRDQLLACHPRLPEFLLAKRKYDRDEIFQSSWYRETKAMFEGELSDSERAVRSG